MPRAGFRKSLGATQRMLAFAGLVAAVATRSAFSQAAPPAVTPPARPDGATQLDAVEVTGSRLRRTDAETALPVTTISSDDIARSGVQDMEQLIQYLSATDTAGASRGSDLAGVATYGLSSVSLRGLGDVRTLVLLNGRRLSVFAGTGSAVDINSIPLSAIDRVEVLRDGASTAYGTDAVAGVINFILRNDFTGARISTLRAGPTRGGGAGSAGFNMVFGDGAAADGKVTYLLTGDVSRSRALFARDRDFSRTGNNPPYYVTGATPSGRVEGQWRAGVDSDGDGLLDGGQAGNTFPYTSASRNYGNPAAPWPDGANGMFLDTAAAPGYHADDQCPTIDMFFAGQSGRDLNGDAVPDFYNCNFDSAPFVGLFPETRRQSAFGSIRARITPDMAYYAEASYSRTQLTEAYQPSPVRASFLATDRAFEGSGVDPAILIQPTNANYPAQYLAAIGAPTTTPYAVTLRTFLTGPRTEQDTNTSVRFVNGLQGTFGFARGWTYDVSALYNSNRTSGRVIDGYFSLLALASILNCQPTCADATVRDSWNPWAPGGVQPAAVTTALEAAKYDGPTLSGSSTLASVEATTTTALGDMAGGPLQIALGGTARREYFKVDVPAVLGSGDIAGLGGATLPQDSSRTVAAAYAEVNLPILVSLAANLSGRYDHYSDVGGATNGKLTIRYQPIRAMLFRASGGTGFRAPTLVELFQPIVLGTSERFVDPNDPAGGPIQVNALLGGNPGLKPEKSRQFSLGTVVSPISDLSFGADYFWISIDKYITAPSALGLVVAAEAGTPLYGPGDVTFVTPGDPTSGIATINQVNRNAASACVSGIDVSADYRLPLRAAGTVGFGFDGTYMDRYVLKTLSSYQRSVGTIVDDAGNPLDVAGQGVVARWKHVAAVNWRIGPFTATFAQNYYSAYRDANNQVDGRRHDVPAQSIFDAQVAAAVPFAATHRIDVALGARNLFDRDPPLYIGNGTSFQYGYDPTMYDPRGRVLYLKLGYSLP